MAVTTRTFHIATCDVCAQQFNEADEYWAWDDTPELALDQVTENPDWMRLDDDRIVCPRNDTTHHQLRGGESPQLARTPADVMTVTVTA
jgi:hypothetical protein